MVRSSLILAAALAAVLAMPGLSAAQERNPEADAIAERTMQARVPGPMTMVGTLSEVQRMGRRIVLDTMHGEETIDVRSDAQIYMGNEALTGTQLADHVGARVTVSYEQVVDMKLASSLILREADQTN